MKKQSVADHKIIWHSKSTTIFFSLFTSICTCSCQYPYFESQITLGIEEKPTIWKGGCCHVIKNGSYIGRFLMCSIILSAGLSSETKDYWPDSFSRWTSPWPSIWSNSRITWQYGSITVECFSARRGSFEEYCSSTCLRQSFFTSRRCKGQARNYNLDNS